MARSLLLCMTLCFVPLRAGAAEFYVDPVNGSSGPQGKGIDIGAYEWHSGDALPAEDSSAGK